MENEKGIPIESRIKLMRSLPDGIDRSTPWTPYLGNSIFLTRHFKTVRFNVGIAIPILVLSTPYAWPFVFVNEGSFIIYLGPNQSVSAASGYPLFAGDKEPYVVEENSEIWAIAAGGTGNLAILEV